MKWKILYMALYLLLFTALLLLTGAASRSHRMAPVVALTATVDRSCGNDFISEAGLIEAVIARFDSLQGRKLPSGTLQQIRQMLYENPYVKKAAVYRDMGGGLHIRVSQRQPIIRVLNRQNQSFYLDKEGRMLPLSDRYTPRVPVATGHIEASFASGQHIWQETEPDQPGLHRLRELHQLAGFLWEDAFWHAMMDHIVVERGGGFTLIPKNGAHEIAFGDLAHMEDKFDNLLAFYMHGLSQVGWDHYRKINLQFDQQIVCTK